MIPQTAIFVDAGYIYENAAASLGSPGLPRERIRVHVTKLVDELCRLADTIEPDGRLLRIYWYDALRRGGELTPQQREFMRADNVKCRFGTINSSNQQKGVDSLIVTDLVELARNRVISDAILVSGDEDLRVGVQTVQTFGVRTHVLGISPARLSQSYELLADADTKHEWGSHLVETWLEIIPDEEPRSARELDEKEWIRQVVDERTATLTIADAQWISDFASANKNALPGEFDKPSLGLAGEVLGRELSTSERKAFRIALLEAVRELAAER